MTEESKCPYEEFCKDCHPEEEYQKRREKCDRENCRQCGVYWAFHDGYALLDDC